MPRTARFLGALALLLLASSSGPGARAEEGRREGGWPFGSAGPFGAGQDLWNLGLLGAKARDPAARETATPDDASGGVRTGRMERGRDDDGPRELEIVLLLADGPAARAGLAPGDRVIGVGRSPFKEGALAPLDEALRDAEAGDGALTLLVRRAGADRVERLGLTVPAGGKAAARPTRGEGRRRVVEQALAWLAGRQEPAGGFPSTLSGVNGAVVQASLAGLAWLAGGSDDQHGPYARNVAAAADFVIRNVGATGLAGGLGDPRGGGGASWDQTNWGYAHAAIFLGELCARRPSPAVTRGLLACGEALARRQERSGGWAHGPGGPNALGYVELNIVTGLALCGLGLARRAGQDVPAEVLERADAYLQASSAGDGGVGYSDKPGQRGQGNVGRTAAAWLGYQALGLGKGAWGQKMRKWVARNAGGVMDGHASLMQHVLLAGVAAHALGGKALATYWDAVERDLVLARAPDGSLQPRPWHESLSIGSNSDVSFGEVWTTAAWAIVLACEPERGGRPGLPAWMGLEPAGRGR